MFVQSMSGIFMFGSDNSETNILNHLHFPVKKREG